ncbi:BON domain-containing protein [Granulosicoccus sp. 3-233]|uniref:BON domain-containing protein n=1 Tax=Granulosicoccus sp. 3-233 TaxID=3417969 RepID=UPI003D34E5EF
MTVRNVMKMLLVATVLATVTACTASPTRESTGEFVDNTVVTAKVKSALAKDSLGTLVDVEVETFRDVVQLSGFVDSEEDKARAEELASAVEGVGSVENSLIVKQ